MSDEQLKKTFLRELAEASIPNNYDPWPVLQARINREGLYKTIQQKHTTKSVNARGFKPVTAIIIILIMAFGLFLFANPQGNALAQAILRFFIPTQSVEEPDPAVSTPIPLIEITPIMNANNAIADNSNLEEVQRKINYPLMQLSFLPQGYHFEFAQVEGERVTLFYKNDADGASLWLEQLPLHGAEPEPMSVGPDAPVESAQVGNNYAEYIKGSYFGDQGIWNSDSGASFLRWQHDDMLYTISLVVNSSLAASKANLSKETLLTMAENLTEDTTKKFAFDPSHINDLEVAEKLAGFKLLVPTVLPQGYQFDFATIEEDTGFVCLQYAYNGASYPSLFIRQSAEMPLSTLQADTKNKLEISTVRVAGSEGGSKYAIGFRSPGKACDLQNDIFRTGQTLFWKTSGMSLEMYAEFRPPEGGAGLSKEQMIALAESILGSSSSNQALLDMNSYSDLAEAELVAGHNIHMPAKLPLGSKFNSIHLLGNSSMSLFTNSQFGSPNIKLYQCPSIDLTDSPCHNLMEKIPENIKTQMTMGNLNAVYVKGDFGKEANEADPSWHEMDPSLTQQIYWRSGNWDYLLISTGDGINQQLLAEIAETVH